ncbi:hypothetical protein PMAG_a2244 [Pseudoalteromonas mariniglutinosa NCIMB 1770]|nr:hypothetical protein [Pseudoalteromonas mariniglutinosa NCIMB 1770]
MHFFSATEYSRQLSQIQFSNSLTQSFIEKKLSGDLTLYIISIVMK